METEITWVCPKCKRAITMTGLGPHSVVAVPECCGVAMGHKVNVRDEAAGARGRHHLANCQHILETGKPLPGAPTFLDAKYGQLRQTPFGYEKLDGTPLTEEEMAEKTARRWKQHHRQERLEVASRVLAGMMVEPGTINACDPEKHGGTPLEKSMATLARIHADALIAEIDKD